jgi:altronate dehydratase
MGGKKKVNNNALKVNSGDNVVIATRQIKKGEEVVVDNVRLLKAAEDVPPSHKIALLSIKKGDAVIRYGEPIVLARADIKQGEWVHVHNTDPIVRAE